MNDQQQAINQLAENMVRPQRSPVLKTPGDYGMEYQDIFFPSIDGVALEAWFIPADGSNKLIAVNHPMPMNRYGFPGHLEPWSQTAPIEVNFIPAYKHLHDAGYNVLTYDLRNHGNSGAANGGVVGIGLYEWRDVVGCMKYIKGHERLSAMEVGLLSHCMGGNATIIAMAKCPEAFERVRGMVIPQPGSLKYLVKYFAGLLGLGDKLDEIDFEFRRLGGFALDQMSAHEYAKAIKVPVLYTQVHDDLWTKPEDVQTTYDLTPVGDKELFWIEGTNRRFDGYNYFNDHPELLLGFFAKRMG